MTNASLLRQTETSLHAIVKQNFSRWSACLQSGEPSQAASLYAADAVFLPTLSGIVHKGPQGALEYYSMFLKLQPEVTILSESIMSIGDGAYAHCGLYAFRFRAGDIHAATARFTFVWRSGGNGEWMIAHHHSSASPA